MRCRLSLLLLLSAPQLCWLWRLPRAAVHRPPSRRGARRCLAPAMLEAYDLMPVVECLKAPDMDAVELCLERVEPWLQITERGDVLLSEAAIAGFIGGTVRGGTRRRGCHPSPSADPARARQTERARRRWAWWAR